ncbi:hypothetical protein FRC09_016855, partial [Ceratobasidium sp. 395]
MPLLYRQSVQPPMPQPPFLAEQAAPYPVLLDAYPCPAFVVRANAILRPIWANRAFYSAFGAPGVPLADCFVHALATTEDGEHYALWCATREEQSRTHTGRKRSWIETDNGPEPSVIPTTAMIRVRTMSGEMLLQLVKSEIDSLLIITSIVESASQPTRDVSPVPPKRMRDDSQFPGSLAPLPPLRLNPNQLLTPELTPMLPLPSPTSPRSADPTRPPRVA